MSNHNRDFRKMTMPTGVASVSLAKPDRVFTPEANSLFAAINSQNASHHAAHAAMVANRLHLSCELSPQATQLAPPGPPPREQDTP